MQPSIINLNERELNVRKPFSMISNEKYIKKTEAKKKKNAARKITL